MALTDKDIARLNYQVQSFGKARSPLNEFIGNERIVVADGRLYRIPKNWTFHEFLLDFGIDRLGQRWLSKRLLSKEAHQLLDCFSSVQSTDIDDGSTWVELKDSVSTFCFLTFCYDLFTIEDNVEVQSRLLKRIRLGMNYFGARYELYVAATFVRAGFEIEFENDQSDSSHCEFLATHRETGKQFSVEAKRRSGNDTVTDRKNGPKILKILKKALLKKAVADRIIFLELPESGDSVLADPGGWQLPVMRQLSLLESSQRASDPWPRAVLFVTRGSIEKGCQTGLNSRAAFFTGINHDLFKQNDTAALRLALPELGQLYYSATNNSVPPPEFFGQGVRGFKGQAE